MTWSRITGLFTAPLVMMGGLALTSRAQAQTPVALYTCDQGSGSTVTNTGSLGTAKNATLTGTAAWSTDRKVGTYALSLNGSTVATATGNVVATNASFTAAAWVKFNNLTAYQTILSINGTNVSAFYLQYNAGSGRITFNRLASDSVSAASTVANATAAPTAGTWYHVAGVYNSTAKTIALYINGVLQATTSYTTGWAATGNTLIGAGRFSGATADYVNGLVDDARFYTSALTAAQVLTLYNMGTTTAPVSRTWTPASTTAATAPADRKGFAFGSAFAATYVGVQGTENTASTTSVTSYKYVTLKLASGKLRSWPVDSFIQADKDYVAAQAAVVYPTDSNTYTVYPTNYALTDPVTTYQSQHFCWWWGNNTANYLAAGSLWLDATFRQNCFDMFEDLWNFFHTQRNVTMPYQNVPNNPNNASDTARHKLNIFVCDTGLSLNPDGWANGGVDIQMAPGAMLAGSTTIAHEFQHTIQMYSGGFEGWDATANVGWIWESHAGFGSFQYQPTYPQVLDLWNNHMYWETNSDRDRYGSWLFMQDIYENLSATLPYDVWFNSLRNSSNVTKEDPTQAYIRVGGVKGVFTGDTTQAYGDEFGKLAARAATMDFIQQQTLLDFVGYPRTNDDVDYPRYTPAEAVPDRPGYYRPYYQATPLQYGMNIIKLSSTPGTAITVNLASLAESIPQQQDYRATLVVADANNLNARYSTMVHTGSLTITPATTETNAYLAVAATPTAYQIDGFRQGFQRRRPYAYEFSITGATPMAPTPLQSTSGVAGTTFANGGGFVSNTASVAATAYVGPNAVVLGGTVSGSARIEGHAMVISGTVQDSAIVSDYAVIDGGIIMSRARVRGAARVSSGTTVTDDACVYDLVKLIRGGTLGGFAVAKGNGFAGLPGYTVSGSTIIDRDSEYWAGQNQTYGRFYEFSDLSIQQAAEDGKYLYANWSFDQPQPSHILMDAWVSNDGVLRGATTPTFTTDTSDGTTRNVMALNGVDQYVLVGKDVSDTKATTYDMMVKWTGGAYDQRIFDFGGNTGTADHASTDDGIYLTPSDGTGHVMKLVIKLNGVTTTLASTAALPTGVWSRVRVELTGTTGRLFLNGTQVATGTLSFVPENLCALSNFLGRSQAGTGFFNGSMDFFRVYRTVFTTFSTVGEPPAAQWTYVAPVPPT